MLGKIVMEGLGLINVDLELGWKHIKPAQNCSHTYNLSTMNFFGNVWTSHLEIFLFVLNIFD
jgi:hypothetical protein